MSGTIDDWDEVFNPLIEEIKRPRKSHIWKREQNEHYVEPEWVSKRLFEVENFAPGIWDPCCGFGRIPQQAFKQDLKVFAATDIVARGYGHVEDFLKTETAKASNIVCNPPFELVRAFVLKALSLRGVGKVAMIFPTARLNAARWLTRTPLQRVWLLTPRPSMPPGHVILDGGKVGGGRMDFCWLVWDTMYKFDPKIRWLNRDES